MALLYDPGRYMPETPGGFCVGWRAEPVARLDRGPQQPAAQVAPQEGDVLDLDGFQQSPHMSTAFHHRWGLPPDHDVVCSTRPPIGWFGQVPLTAAVPATTNPNVAGVPRSPVCEPDRTSML